MSLKILLLAVVLACAGYAHAKRIETVAEAVAVAEPALIAKFGKEEIAGQRPFRVRVVREESKEAVWIVEGAMRKRLNDKSETSNAPRARTSWSAVGSWASMAIILLRLTLQISHARRAGKPSLLKYRAMLSGAIICDLGDIKGVAAVAAG